jgi:flagellar protein FliS
MSLNAKADAARRQRFVDDAVSTASPARLICLLYDRLQLDLTLAVHALGEGDRPGAAASIGHAQQIVLELRGSLDVDAWEGGPGLASLYAWILGELGRAMVAADPALVQTCADLVAPLRAAWHEAAGGSSGATAAA